MKKSHRGRIFTLVKHEAKRDGCEENGTKK